MSQRLIILLPAYEGGAGLWGQFDGESLMAHGRSAPPADAPGEVIAILPGQMVRIYAHELPSSSKRDRLRAAGFSIEEKIAVPLSQTHIVVDEDRIGVVSTSALQDSLKQLEEAGLNASSAYSDFDVLSDVNGQSAILGRIITAGPLGHTLDEVWEEQSRASTLSDEQALAAIAAHIESGAPLNFLQNEFSAKQGFALNWRGFIPAGALAASLLVAALVFQTVQTRALKMQSADLKTQMREIYSQASGKAAPSNPALAATRALKAGGGDRLVFLKLSDILFRGVANVEGVSVDQLRYQDNNKVLQLRLIYPSFESAAQFEAAIKSAGGQLVTGGVRDQSGQFVGDATLSGVN